MRTRSAEWCFDADTIGVGRVLAEAGVRATWPGDDGALRGRPHLLPCTIDRTDIADEVWIEEVTRAGMSIITRDRRIASRTSEVDAVIASRARVFALTVKGENDLWRLRLTPRVYGSARHLSATVAYPHVCRPNRSAALSVSTQPG